MNATSEDRTVTISNVVGEGDAAHRLVRVGAWGFTLWEALGDGEPRIRDVDAAKRLALGRPRKIRELIRRTWPGAKIRQVHVRPTVGRTSMPRGGYRNVVVDEFWLTEAQLLKVIARSETEIADAILDDMIRVYIAVRRGLVQPAPAPATDARLVTLEAQAAELVRLKRWIRFSASLRDRRAQLADDLRDEREGVDDDDCVAWRPHYEAMDLLAGDVATFLDQELQDRDGETVVRRLVQSRTRRAGADERQRAADHAAYEAEEVARRAEEAAEEVARKAAAIPPTAYGKALVAASLAALSNRDTAGATLRYLATLCNEVGLVHIDHAILAQRMHEATGLHINAATFRKNCESRLGRDGWLGWVTTATDGTHIYRLQIPPALRDRVAAEEPETKH